MFNNLLNIQCTNKQQHTNDNASKIICKPNENKQLKHKNKNFSLGIQKLLLHFNSIRKKSLKIKETINDFPKIL